MLSDDQFKFYMKDDDFIEFFESKRMLMPEDKEDLETMAKQDWCSDIKRDFVRLFELDE